ncbi:kinase-like domain-containing protein [Rhizophagus clarus]|nr:kinase-like domain-containing protein [Rhizophagus clarus]
MILKYIYGGKLSLEKYETSDIIKILVASSELSLQELIPHLQLFLIENKKNWMKQNFNLIYQTSFKNDSFLILQNFCSELMFKEPEKIFNSIDFILLPEKYMISLIQHDNFQINVIQVWEHVLKWGIGQNPGLPSDPSGYSKDDFNALKITLQQLIPFIKFFNLNNKEFLDKVYPYKKILPNDLRENLIKHFINQPDNNPESIITSMANLSIQKNLSIEKYFNLVDEINDFINKLLNKGVKISLVKRQAIEYFSAHDINSKETYNWLLNNQVSANSIFLLGYFNFHGIVTSENDEKAFNLFINASKKDHILAQFFVGKCYKFGYGVIKNEKLAFKHYEKIAKKNSSCGQLNIGYFYEKGIGIKKNLKMALCWYEKAANNGNVMAIHNLGVLYRDGIGIKKDYNKAFELFKQSAEGGYSGGITKLGYCYDEGVGTKIDKRRAFELYQNAANLGDEAAQNNLALMYEDGDGITKDIDKAIYWYNKSAKQGREEARNNLKRLKKSNNL